MSKALCEIMKDCGSDKGADWHNYTEFYDMLFRDLRNDSLNIFELGLGTTNKKFLSHMKPQYTPCGSLRGWREYFPNANIHGADVDHDILVTEDRIQTYHVDQTNILSIGALWHSIESTQFDIIIDDGLHTLPAATTFFKNSIHRLKPNGIYIIEDVKTAEVINYMSTFSNLSENFIIKDVRLPHPYNKTDNNLLLILPSISSRYYPFIK